MHSGGLHNMKIPVLVLCDNWIKGSPESIGILIRKQFKAATTTKTQKKHHLSESEGELCF
jgi:hypothetical protein